MKKKLISLHEGHDEQAEAIDKLITFADTREAALAKMRQALDELVVDGIRTNAALHRELVTDTSFMAGGVSIHYLESKLEHEH